jgi:hypothetical protein
LEVYADQETSLHNGKLQNNYILKIERVTAGLLRSEN